LSSDHLICVPILNFYNLSTLSCPSLTHTIKLSYDIRFPEYSLLLAQTYKCNLLIFPGAFNLTTGPAHWELLQRARAVDQQCFVLTASPARILPPLVDDNENDKGSPYPHYTAWGHSTAISPWGTVLATCDEDEALVLCDLDMELVKNMRQGIPTSSQKRTDLYRLYGVDDTERF
jgi:omega-amidase